MSTKYVSGLGPPTNGHSMAGAGQQVSRKKVESESFLSNEYNCFQKLHLPTINKLRLTKFEKFSMAGSVGQLHLWVDERQRATRP